MTDKFYVETATGRIRTVDNPEQAQELAQQGRTFVSPETAKQEYGQEVGGERVANEYGTLGQAALGAASGLTLGLGPAAYSWLSGDKKFANDYSLMQGSSPFFAGEAAGMLLPAIFSGGESTGAKSLIGSVFGASPAGIMGRVGGAAERYALRALPEASSALGTAGRAALSLAARGASEGAIMNMSQQISRDIIQDHPLTAQSMIATGQAGLEGALFGGLLGGAMGGAGSLLGSGLKAAGGLGADKSGMAAMRRIGANAADMEQIGAKGTVKEALQGFHDTVMKPGGVNFSSDINKINKVARETIEEAQTVQKDILGRLDKETPVGKPNMGRVASRLNQEVLSPYVGTLARSEAQRAVDSIVEDLAGKSNAGPPTWSKWAESRNQLAERVGAAVSNPALKQRVTQQALTVVDSELNSAMAAAAEGMGEKGLAAQFSAASAQERMAKHLSEMTSRKLAGSPSGLSQYFNPQDARSSLWLGALGHPASGAALLASKAIGRAVTDAVEPFLAQRSYEMAIGAKAASSVAAVRSRAKEAVGKFFNVGRNEAAAAYGRRDTKAAPKQKESSTLRGSSTPEFTNEDFDKSQEIVSQLLSAQHRQSVASFAQSLAATGHPELGQELLNTYDRAAMYMAYNKKKERLPSLTKTPKSFGLDPQQWKNMRQMGIIGNPLSVLDKMEDGSLSIDEVKTLKYVYPDVHKVLVEEISAAVFQAHQEGKTLPMDQVTQLGVALDAPIDFFLEPDFVASLQASMAIPGSGAAGQTSGLQQNGPQPQQNASMGTEAVSNLMTPLQKSAYG